MRRRSLHIAEDLAPGDLLTPQNLRRIRPGHVLEPKYFDTLLGNQVRPAVIAETPMGGPEMLEVGLLA
ncbi:hypothetical protein [Thiocapsa sp. C2-2m]|uniref:hypothetical protein n=1 Tax=Thiocapsa sp. C2-2m TaxID=3137395 RepID=UPI0035B32C2D